MHTWSEPWATQQGRFYDLPVVPHKAVPEASKGKGYINQKDTVPIGIDCNVLNTYHSSIQCHSMSTRPIRFRRGPFFCWWLDQGSLEEAHCCLTTKYYSVLQSTAPCYSVLQVIYLIVCRNTWNIIYIWQSNLWGAKHNGTMTFIFDSRNSWNVSYIAQSNLWDAKHNGTLQHNIFIVATHGTSMALRGAAWVTLQHHRIYCMCPAKRNSEKRDSKI